MAWLNTAPEKAEGDKSKAAPITRLARMRKDREDDTYRPPMPPLECGEYMAGYLWEVGPTMSAGMGQAPVSHLEIKAWQEVTGIDLEPWEARLLRRLSLEYLSESHKAEKLDCPAPWKPEDRGEELKSVAKSFFSSMRELIDL